MRVHYGDRSAMSSSRFAPSQVGAPQPDPGHSASGRLTGSGRRHVREVVLAAAVLGFLLGVCFIAPAPFWQAKPTIPPQASTASVWTTFSPLGLMVAIGLLAAFSLPFYPYSRALRAVHEHRAPIKLVLLLTAALAIVALAIYPIWGSDVFEYIAEERVWTAYGDNPLTASPSLHPQDWAYVYSWFPDATNAYGPLWPILTWPVGMLVQNVDGAVVAYKLLALIAYVGTCALIWHLSRPSRSEWPLLYFAWNPLVLFDILAKAHNDVWIAVGALAALALAERPRSALFALPTITAAVLVKASAAPMGLLLFAAEARRSKRRALIASLISGCLVILLFLPFGSGLSIVVSVLDQIKIVAWSPLTLVLLPMEAMFGGAAETPVRAVGAAVCLALACVLAAAWRRRTTAGMATALALLILIGYLLLTTAFYAHYLVPIVALAAISDSPVLKRVVFALSLGSLAAYAVELGSLAVGSAWIGSAGYLLAGSLLETAPAALVLAWTWRRARRRPDAYGPTARSGATRPSSG